RAAIDWVMDRQGVRTDRRSGIVNDANEWATETMGNPKYPLEVLLRVLAMSVRTRRIVLALPDLDINNEFYESEGSDKNKENNEGDMVKDRSNQEVFERWYSEYLREDAGVTYSWTDSEVLVAANGGTFMRYELNEVGIQGIIERSVGLCSAELMSASFIMLRAEGALRMLVNLEQKK